jgi:hypothetical protein
MKFFLFLSLFYLLNTSFAYTQQYKPIDTSDSTLRKENVLRFDLKTKEYIAFVKEKYIAKYSTKIADDFKGFSKDFVKEIAKSYKLIYPLNTFLNRMLHVFWR